MMKIYFRNYLTYFNEIDSIQARSKEDLEKEIVYDFEKWIGDIQEIDVDDEQIMDTAG